MTLALSFCHNTSASSVKRPQLSILRFSPPPFGEIVVNRHDDGVGRGRGS